MPSDQVDAFRRMLKLLEVTPEQLRALARDLGIPDDIPASLSEKMERPPLPETMCGLACAMDPTTMFVAGDLYSDTGFNERGHMTLVLNTPTQPLGAVEITREQAKILRDFLTTKLGD